MEIGELRKALRMGIPLLWQGKYDYERAIGHLSGIVLRNGPNGEDVFSCELTTRRNSILLCKPEELRVYDPVKSEK